MFNICFDSIIACTNEIGHLILRMKLFGEGTRVGFRLYEFKPQEPAHQLWPQKDNESKLLLTNYLKMNWCYRLLISRVGIKRHLCIISK